MTRCFQNQGFDAKTLHQIENTTLADIILRDTDTQHIQDDVFVYADRHTGTTSGIAADHPNAPQLVIGAPGHDTLIGGPADDTLVAAPGLDRLTGGAGNDRFILPTRGMDATITDFQPGRDKIEFENAGSLTLRNVHVETRHDSTVLHVGSDEVVLAHILPQQLHANDFIFHT